MRRQVPGVLPTRVAGTGDRWGIRQGTFDGHSLWFASPVEVGVDAMPGRKHALFFTHAEAVRYAAARAKGARHSDVCTFEYSTLTRARGRQKAAVRRAGYASRSDD
ncbi:hypothetical protein ACFVTX_18060 [Agromyces sp. NPDC058136]|uniref:hypothetical protein n=1 Tax=Agromyces sp. NPDC058136 TaxID=3346354 RepID=UPI0036D875C2